MQSPEVKIGIALGGGGAKGGAHIGAIKVFEQYGIKPSLIAGTSIGSTIGALWGLGEDVEGIIKRVNVIKKMDYSNLRNFRFFGESLVGNKKINPMMRTVFQGSTFKDLKIPVIINATDLESGNEVVITKGELWKAARASSAVPFIFKPVFIEDHYVVDGGLLNNVPINHIKENEDIDIIIGINLGGMTSKQYISAMVWQKYYKKPETFKLYPSFITRWKLNTSLMSHIMIRSLDIAREASQQKMFKDVKPDFIISPSVENIQMLDFTKYEEGIEKGEQATQKIMPDLLKLIEQKREEKQKKLYKTKLENKKLEEK